MTVARTLLPLYRFGMRGFGFVAMPFLHWRLARGKEEAGRLSEKTGLAGKARPPGQLAWLHGASVGESIALLPLVERLVQRGLNVLVTTGTVSSARILGERLGPGALHQYMPLDVPRFLSRFLDHWQPDIVLVAESEIWPNLFADVDRAGVPLVLVSARLSQRSYGRWQKFATSIRTILRQVDLCMAQTQEDAERLQHLGAPRVQVSGNLKYDVPALPADNGEVASLAAAIGGRPVWLAASTHAGEEMVIGRVHLALRQRFPELLTIIAPRHAPRALAVGQALEREGLVVSLRSRQAEPDERTDIFLADTMGEMGLFYRLTNIVFVGKSLECNGAHAGGGQNPIEPAKLGNAILHGPLTGNFGEVFAGLDAAGGGIEVEGASDLAQVLGDLLDDRVRLRAVARKAQETVGRLGGACDKIMHALEPWLMQMQLTAGMQR